jgi:hypothetical protein
MNQDTFLSPPEYIRTKAHLLPLKECLITKGWKYCDMVHVIIARQHASGEITLCVFLIDIYCLGVKDTSYYYRISPEEYEQLKETIPLFGRKLTEVSYAEAEGLISGSVSYAKGLGIPPHKDFSITKHIFGESGEAVSPVDIQFGYKGKPLLRVDTPVEVLYISHLKANAKDGFEVKYTNRHTSFLPAYPTKLKLVHAELQDLFLLNPDYPAGMTDRILSLPRESLIDDLIHCLYVELGRTGNKSGERLDEIDSVSLIKTLFGFLAELRAERSLPVILEVLRQGEDFVEFHFSGDFGRKDVSHTLYCVGGRQLPALSGYMKEQGLYPLRSCVLAGVARIVSLEKERRGEVIEWFRDLIRFYAGIIGTSYRYDADIVSQTISSLVDIRAVELLPDIQTLFDTGWMDTARYGDRSEVARRIRTGSQA